MATLKGIKALSGERGSQIIEASLVLPLLLLVLLGILDFGMLFWRYESVTNAAREGARVAILPGYTESDVQNRVLKFLDDAGLTDTPSIEFLDPMGVDVGGGVCITMTGARVTYPHEYFLVGAIMGYFGGPGLTNTSLEATSMMRYEGPSVACP